MGSPAVLGGRECRTGERPLQHAYMEKSFFNRNAWDFMQVREISSTSLPPPPWLEGPTRRRPVPFCARIHIIIQPLPPLHYTCAASSSFVFPLCTHALAYPRVYTNILISRNKFFFLKKNSSPAVSPDLRYIYISELLTIAAAVQGIEEWLGWKTELATTPVGHDKRPSPPRWSAEWWCQDRAHDIIYRIPTPR